MSIERDFDVPLIAGLALREKQIQQNYRPVIGVHKWFARRPGTLFRRLLLAEFGTGPLQDTFFAGNDLLGRRIADPFMGGGTPLIEANRLGCDVQGFDLNPMAAWIVREEIDHLDLAAYGRAAGSLVDTLRGEIGRYYRTFCPRYGDAEVPVKSFLWVKTIDCAGCGEAIDLFPDTCWRQTGATRSPVSGSASSATAGGGRWAFVAPTRCGWNFRLAASTPCSPIRPTSATSSTAN